MNKIVFKIMYVALPDTISYRQEKLLPTQNGVCRPSAAASACGSSVRPIVDELLGPLGVSNTGMSGNQLDMGGGTWQ